MKISIIVPVYNRIENLKYLIYCLKRQTSQIDELIIADDGSSVDVVNFLKKEVNDLNSTVKYIWQKDLGFRKTRALNNAVKEARGEILIFLDQDVILPFNFIEIIKKKYEKRIFFTF